MTSLEVRYRVDEDTVEDNLEELFGYAIKAWMVLKALHRKMLHRHLRAHRHVLQLIPKSFHDKLRAELVELELFGLRCHEG